MITVYTIAYNEEHILEYFIKFYRERFPNCEINIYDNYSTDKTALIAKSNNCNVIPFDTNNQISEIEYLKIKNNCWKTAKTNWVLVCDCDELLDITQQQLISEETNSNTLIQTQAYHMVNKSPLTSSFDYNTIKFGIKEEIKTSASYSKFILFNKAFVDEINYGIGCHQIVPKGKVLNISTNIYKLLHYKYIDPELMVQKYYTYKSRLSKENIKNAWGVQYCLDDFEIVQNFMDAVQQSKKVLN